VARCSPIVDCEAVDRFFPQADPAPWAALAMHHGMPPAQSWFAHHSEREISFIYKTNWQQINRT